MKQTESVIIICGVECLSVYILIILLNYFFWKKKEEKKSQRIVH